MMDIIKLITINLKRVLNLRASARVSLVTLMAMLTFSSCVKEHITPMDTVGSNEEKSITLQLHAPYFAMPTRAISETTQDVVSTIDVLAFRIDDSDGDSNYDNDPETFDYHAPTYMEGMQRKVKVVIKPYPQRFVVIANASDEVRNLVAAYRGANPDREAMMAKLQMSLPAGAIWNATSNSDFKPLPMFGESDGMVVSASTSGIGAIQMVRMHSKIEIMLKDEIFNNKTFQLRDVRLYNANRSGRVMPIINTTDTYYDRAGNQAKQPSLPSSVEVNTNPLLYTADLTAIPSEGRAMMGGIFTFEANASTKATPEKQPSIVIGGVFEEETDGSGNEIVTYYRVDFVDPSKNYLSLLRNHSYTVKVNGVSRRGFDTPDEAFNAKAINIDTEVVVWDNGMWEEVADDGQYKMAVSQKVYEFYKEAKSGNKLTISTDWTGGLEQIKFSNDPTNADAGGAEWITQASLTNDGMTTGLKTYELTFDVANNNSHPTTPRTGYIHLISGRMHMVVRVDQNDQVSNMLVAMDSSGQSIDVLEFAEVAGIQPVAQTFKVKWSPKMETLYIWVSSVANPKGGNYDQIIWTQYDTQSEGIYDIGGTSVWVTPINNGSGEVEFTVRPAAITTSEMGGDPFYERQVQLTFRATGSEGTMRKTVLLQQIVINADVNIDYFYLADGSKHNFLVTSNVPWRATLLKNGNGIIENTEGTLLMTGGYNLPDGAKVEFKSYDDLSSPTKFTGTGKVKVEYMDNYGVWHTVEQNSTDELPVLCLSGIVQPLSNTYIVKPNGLPILIPVKRANGWIKGVNDAVERRQPDWSLGDQITNGGANDTFGSKLVWTDTPNSVTPVATTSGLGDLAAVSLIRTAGNNSESYIFIKPGSRSGNAVVAATRNANVGNAEGTGDILWSWHIWVTEYAPATTNIWMDRNLGATTASSGVATSLGNFYQWGRKDPLPGAKTITDANTTAGRDIYDANGNITLPGWSTENTLPTSVKNPLTGISGWSGSNDRFSWNTIEDRSGLKTIYDPCPDGWRVPIRDGLADNTTLTDYNRWTSTGNTKHWGNETFYITNAQANHVQMIQGTWTRGFTWTSAYGYKGGYYPAGGSRFPTGVSSVGMSGYYWSASPNDGSSYHLYFSNGSVYPNNFFTRQSGFSIRCVSE